MSLLEKANYEFRNKDYKKAIELYEKFYCSSPDVLSLVKFNKVLAKRKLAYAIAGEDFNSYSMISKSAITDACYNKEHPARFYLLNRQVYSVDIVIPVYNALEDVKKCLNSVAKNKDGFLVNVYIVNDFSDDATTAFLRDFCYERDGFNLIEHSKNEMYTKTVNDGLKASDGDYVITLNSDTVVTKGWLQNLIRCMLSDNKIGIVGPLSNAASWQNVPELLDDNGQFAVNEIPLNMSPDEMAEVVWSSSQHTYPRVPFVNGFCFMISRKVLDSIGFLDEVSFPTGYGEENDFCIRAIDAGFELAIADDTYVFHAKSKSFGHEQRKKLSKKGSEQLKIKHTEKKFKTLVDKVKNTTQLDYVRNRIKDKLKQKVFSSKSVFESIDTQKNSLDFKLLFLLPVQGGGGGAHSVVQEAFAMRRLGVNVNIAMKHEQVQRFYENYEDIPDYKNMFVGFSDNDLVNLTEDYDVVVATLFSSVKFLKKIVDSNPHILPAYYIQDYEPLFFDEGSENWKEAYRSYSLIPNVLCFAKTNWIIDKVFDLHGVKVHKVSPSIDHEVYKIKNVETPSKKIVISAMIRPKTPRRGAEKTMELLSKIHHFNKGKVEIRIFGCNDDEEDYIKIKKNFNYINYGTLKRRQVAEVLSGSDIFIDMSDYQAFGRTGLEAMACGAVSIVPIYGGADEYAVHDVNSLVVDTFDVNGVYDEIELLIRNKEKLYDMQKEALLTAASYSVHKAAITELVPITKKLALHRKKFQKIKKNEVLILPSLQKDKDTPTGSGYVRLILPYQNTHILKNNRVQIAKKLPDIDLYNDCTLVVQRELPHIELSSIKKWIKKWQEKGNKVIYDLDDDLLDLASYESKGNFSKDSASKVEFMLLSADIVTVSTEKLKEKVSKFSDNIIVVKNFIDRGMWGLDEERDHSQGNYSRYLDRPVTIGYIGTPSHIDDVKLIEDAVHKLQHEYKENIKVEVIGVFQDVKPTFGSRVGLPKKRDYPNFVNWLRQRVHWDIGLIPLEQNEFNKSKSYLKFLEYSALDMAIVVSKHTSYKELTMDGENCLMAEDNSDDWYNKIKNLIENKVLRERIAKKAYKQCADFYCLDNHSHEILRILTAVKK